PRQKATMEITTTANRPFDKCEPDIVGLTTVMNKGNRYVITFQDEITKFVAALPIPNQEVKTVAGEFMRNVVLKFGTPDVILTDQGSNFLSGLFKRTGKLPRVKKLQTTAFYPESNRTLSSH
ncbi:hypothetical protein Cfor_02829, partial [Coptotermes formosanus]